MSHNTKEIKVSKSNVAFKVEKAPDDGKTVHTGNYARKKSPLRLAAESLKVGQRIACGSATNSYLTNITTIVNRYGGNPNGRLAVRARDSQRYIYCLPFHTAPAKAKA